MDHHSGPARPDGDCGVVFSDVVFSDGAVSDGSAPDSDRALPLASARLPTTIAGMRTRHEAIDGAEVSVTRIMMTIIQRKREPETNPLD
jgi:hypothetical protein